MCDVEASVGGEGQRPQQGPAGGSYNVLEERERNI